MSFTAELSGVTLDISIGAVTATLLTRSDFNQMLEDDFSGTFITDFKDTAVFTFVDKSTAIIDVLFDNPHTSFKGQAAAEFNTIRPQVMVQESLLPDTIYHEMKIKVKGKEYFVDDYKSNGVGVLTIFLRLH